MGGPRMQQGSRAARTLENNSGGRFRASEPLIDESMGARQMEEAAREMLFRKMYGKAQKMLQDAGFFHPQDEVLKFMLIRAHTTGILTSDYPSEEMLTKMEGALALVRKNGITDARIFSDSLRAYLQVWRTPLLPLSLEQVLRAGSIFTEARWLGLASEDARSAMSDIYLLSKLGRKGRQPPAGIEALGEWGWRNLEEFERALKQL